jgi:hypothetical protein
VLFSEHWTNNLFLELQKDVGVLEKIRHPLGILAKVPYVALPLLNPVHGMRRSILRRTGFSLYWEKSCPVLVPTIIRIF